MYSGEDFFGDIFLKISSFCFSKDKYRSKFKIAGTKNVLWSQLQQNVLCCDISKVLNRWYDWNLYVCPYGRVTWIMQGIKDCSGTSH